MSHHEGIVVPPENRCHPFAALLDVVMRYLAATGTSAMVEGPFSRQLAASGKYLDTLNDSHLDDRTELQAMHDKDLQAICTAAQEHFGRHYMEVLAVTTPHALLA